jgi:hypothetical protein
MNHIRFVSADELSTLEDYAASLVSGLVTLNSLGKFHAVADSKGLLSEDESEFCKTIIWELSRLMKLYQTQMTNILERTEITAEDVLNKLNGMVPAMKKKPGKQANSSNKQETT